MNKLSLDVFGELLMKGVRDEAIDDWERILNGLMKDEESKLIHKLITESNQFDLVAKLIPKIVDTTLHHLLWTLEQAESIDININYEGNYVKSIKNISDGLAGELYTEDGWIHRFSDKK
jgi:hypothetical protein